MDANPIQSPYTVPVANVNMPSALFQGARSGKVGNGRLTYMMGLLLFLDHG